MANTNIFVFTGNLVAEPEVKMTKSGSKMCTLRIACSTGWGDNKHTSFFRAIAFGSRAEYCETWLAKGNKVCINGSVKADSYENKDGVKIPTFDIMINDIEKLTFEGKAPAPKQAEKQTSIPQGFEAVADEGLPF